MPTFSNVFRVSPLSGHSPSSISSIWRNLVLEGRRTELTQLDSCLFAHKLKSGELVVPPLPEESNPFSSSDAGRSKSTFREFLLLTLSHAERRPLSPAEISLRLQELFVCLSIVISKESHDANGFHYHVGLFSRDASKNTCTKMIRKVFPEFPGSQCNVKFHKGWGTLIGYITKEDKSPYVWGIYSLAEILSIGTSSRNKKKNHIKPTEVILDHLRGSDEWLEVYKSPEIRERLLYGSYSNLKHVHEDLRVLKEIELSSFDKIEEYLKTREGAGASIREYSPEELGEKYLLLDWIAVNLSFNRPIKTKQLHLYGPPSTQKTFILHSLKKVVRIYFASSRSNDFAGADDFYDLWVYDEFHQPDESGLYGPSDSSISACNTLLKVLDGQECRLDAKYSRVIRKKKNVPIIIVSNTLAPKARCYGPFQARFMRLRFVTCIMDLSEDRLIATLRGCILRRLGCDSLPRKSSGPPKFALSYNSDKIDVSLASILNCSEENPLFARTDKGEPVKLEFFNSTPQDPAHPYSYLRLKLSSTCLVSNCLSSLRFSLVPLEKPAGSEDSVPLSGAFPVFFCTRIGGNFRLLRGCSSAQFDYLIWPIRASFEDEERVWSCEIVLVDPIEFSEVAIAPFSPKGIMRSPGSFLQLSLGPVCLKSRLRFDWDASAWDERD